LRLRLCLRASRDNFWQVEDNYIQALGRAAEVNGEEALAEDLLNRTLEITTLSEAEYKNANQGLYFHSYRSVASSVSIP